MLIAGDIGGTKTDLAIFSTEAGPHAPVAETRVRSVDYLSLEAMVKEFLRKTNKPVDRACFAIAGPVIGGRVKTTNLPWVIEESILASELNINRKAVRLVNDLEAIARAIPILRPSDVSTINAGEPVRQGAIAVVAPGTGLGESFLTWDGARYIAHGSEGGHSDFAPTDLLQLRLLRYMLEKSDHVSFEHVCSGIGIPNLYRFLRDVERIPEKAEVAKRMESAADLAAVITEEAFKTSDASPLCGATVDLLSSILASEAGNVALKFLATGGIYFAGGVALHILPALLRPAFLQTFKRKGRFSDLMGRIPIHAIVSPVAIVGAAAYGLESTVADAVAA